jgi:hypothetical protein
MTVVSKSVVTVVSKPVESKTVVTVVSKTVASKTVASKHEQLRICLLVECRVRGAREWVPEGTFT